MALRLASRHLAGLLPASRGLRAVSTEQVQPKAEEEAKPTYTYMSPGDSMRDPGYALGHSLGSPAYEIDHKAARFAPSKQLKQAKQPKPPHRPALQQAASSSPTYVYETPGSSLREASYGISINDPVYVVDPKPIQPKQPATEVKQQPTETSTATQTVQAVSPPPPASKVRIGLKADDFANQPYVTSPKGSMREPHYVSVSDPQDAPHLKK